MIRRDQTATIAFSLGLVAALLALCVRLMVPVGWMPVASNSSVIFTLCSGNGVIHVSLGEHGAPAAPEGGAADGTCAFSLLGTPALPDVPPAVAPQNLQIFIALGLAASACLRLAASNWLRPPVRGP